MTLINTHTAVKKFIKHGFTEEQAEVMVEVINDQNTNLATKTDLFQVKTELRSEIAEVKSELKADIAEVKNKLEMDMAILKTEFSIMKKLQFFIITLLLAPMVAQFLAVYFK